MEKNNLPKIKLHELRHSCASLLLECGIGMKEIQEWLGHSTNAITEKQAQIYESINNSYSPSHHEYESYNFEDKKSVLLSIFEDMKH